MRRNAEMNVCAAMGIIVLLTAFLIITADLADAAGAKCEY